MIFESWNVNDLFGFKDGFEKVKIINLMRKRMKKKLFELKKR